MKNHLIKGLIGLTKFFPRPKRSERRFLVVSTTGLGDTIWGVPALRALRQTYPEAYIGVLTTQAGENLLQHCPYIDEFFFMKNPWLLFKLRKKKFSHVFLFHISQRVMIPLAFFTGAPHLIGTKGRNKDLDSILTAALEDKPIHEVDRRLALVAQAGAYVSNPSLELFLDEADISHATDFLIKHQIPAHLPLVGMHPGAQNLFKQWPPELFIRVGNALADHLGCQILVTGKGSEKPLVDHIAKNIRGALALTDEISILHLGALIKKMDLMITNDTGPMHLAAALQTPTVALFGPTDPKLCGPYRTKRAIVLAHPPTCQPCLKKKCLEPFCMLQISPQQVYSAALELFYRGKS